MAFPPPPSGAMDWPNIGFLAREVNGHIESTYSKSTGQWTPLRFVADPYMRLHGMSPALNYGQQVYEGLKAFRTPGDNKIVVFRPDRNAQRMQHSAEVVSMPPFPVDMFLRAVRAAVALNAEYVPPHDTGAALYIRPQMYGSSAQLGLTAPQEYTFCVFVTPTGVYHGTHPVRALILDDFDRAAPNGVGHAKVGGNYAPVWKWSDKARKEGFDICLHLDARRQEEIDEFSTSGFIGVTDRGDGDVTLVVPNSKSAIDSVTSRSARELAHSYGWKVEQRPVKYAELADFTEVFAAGTAAALVPIRSVTRRQSAGLPERKNVTSEGGVETVVYMPDDQGEAGAACTRILADLKGIQVGRVKDTFGWTHEVTGADRAVEGVEGGEGKNGQVLSVGQTD